MSGRPVLRARPGLSLLSPGEPDTLLADDHGVAWLSGAVLGWIGGWAPAAPRLLLGGLPAGGLWRVGADLVWIADAGDEALRIGADGAVEALRWARPHGPAAPGLGWIAAPGAFFARRLPWEGQAAEADAFGASAPEVAWEGRCLPWPCGGGHAFLHESTLCSRRRGGPTRVLGELPAAPSLALAGPCGSLLLLVEGHGLGAAAGGALIELPDGLDLSEARLCPRGERLLCLREDALVEVNLRDGGLLVRAPEGHRPAGWRGDAALSWEPATGALGVPGGPALALGFGGARPAPWGARLFGPGGFVWDLDRGAPERALVGLGGGLPLDAFTDAAPLGAGLLLLINEQLCLLDEGLRLGPPLRLPRAAGAPLALAAAGGRVHVLCDRAVLAVEPGGLVREGGDTDAISARMDEAGGRSLRPGGAGARWSGAGLAVWWEGPTLPDEDQAMDAIFEGADR